MKKGKTMNVELTIQHMFNEYPVLFKERADCLNHLFCVIENGYKWINGELVDPGCKLTSKTVAKLNKQLVDGKAFQHNKLSLRDEYIYRMKQKGENTSPENTEIDINSIPDDKYYLTEPRTKRWFFWQNTLPGEEIDYCKQYAELWNYPKNIKPDWKNAVEECKEMLRKDGFDI